MPKVQKSSYSANEKLKILLYVKEQRKPQYPETEASLKTWVIEFRKDGIAVIPKMIKIYMKEILIRDFLKQSEFLLQYKTKIGQKLPAQLSEKLLEFQQFIIKKQKQFEYELCEIGNIDETPVYFDMVGNLTIENYGVKSVQVQTTENEKNWFTCVLIVLVIFKGKQIPKNLPSEIILMMHPKGWMDEFGMKT
ncbi:pogo transposable element with KRAB domain [Rhizophagus clarus]|nr:pogo transposable element with KRAB domain [Rhizophagus clarus]